MRRPRHSRVLLAVLLMTLLAGCGARSSSDDMAAYWSVHDPAGPAVDHGAWQRLLDRYLVVADGQLNRVDYARLQADGLPALDAYLASLSGIDPRSLPRDEQMAYWINLYNALTVRLIAANWPLASILTLGDGPLDRGPWDDPVTRINGRTLTLNDIEHRILRGVWREPRIHFAVNCASIGCPDLRARAFSGAALETMLADAARDFLASPRAVAIDDGDLLLSSLFDWYAGDFGSDRAAVIATLASYADPDTAERLRRHRGGVRYHYDWAVNAADKPSTGNAPQTP